MQQNVTELRFHSHPVRTDDQILLIAAVVIDTEHYRTESAVVLTDVNISGTKIGGTYRDNIGNE
jgi:hypothetical protein